MGDRDSDSEPVLQNQDELTTTGTVTKTPLNMHSSSLTLTPLRILGPPTTDPPTSPVGLEDSVIQRQQGAGVLPFSMVEDDRPSRQSQ